MYPSRGLSSGPPDVGCPVIADAGLESLVLISKNIN